MREEYSKEQLITKYFPIQRAKIIRDGIDVAVRLNPALGRKIGVVYSGRDIESLRVYNIDGNTILIKIDKDDKRKKGRVLVEIVGDTARDVSSKLIGEFKYLEKI